MDSEESDSEECVVQFNSKQIDDILNKVNDLQNHILGLDSDTDRALKIQRGLTDLFPDIMSCIGNLKTQSHKVS